MTSTQEQMLQLLEKEELPYADDASASITRTRRMPKNKKFVPEESLNLLETYKPELREQRQAKTKAENVEKMKSVGTGLLTGFAGLPSDIIEGVNFVNDFLAEQGSPKALLFKDVLNEVREKYGRAAFDKKFTEITGIKSDGTNTAQIMGEILSPAGAFVTTAKGVVKVTEGASKLYGFLKDAFKTQTELLTKGDGGIGGSGVLVDGTTISKADTSKQMQQLTDKGDTSVKAAIDAAKGTKTVEGKDNTSAPIIPESEFINAKPTINKLFAGEGTETGKKQAAKFRELEAQNKYTPEELFLKTRVYRGEDGLLRWEINTTDAKLNKSWEKSLNFNYKDYYTFEDPYLGIKVPDKTDSIYDGNAMMQLSKILDFPTAYKEYYNVKKVKKYFDDPQTKTREVLSETQLSPLRNLQVYWQRGDKYDNTLGFYSPNRDQIILNVNQLKAAAQQTATDYGIPFEKAFKLQVESTLLHEVQHAVQLREGFRMGGDSENFLPKDYDIFVSTNKHKKGKIFLDIDDQFDVAIAEMAKKDSSYNALAVRNKILNEVENDFNTLYDVLVHKKTNSIDKYKNKSVKELDSIFREAEERLNNKFSTFKDYIYSQDIDRMKLGLFKNAQENIKLINIDTAATNKYYNLYGEREARLVQKRLEDRFKLKEAGGEEVAKEVDSDTKFLSPKGDTDLRGREFGQLGGFPADTKITPTKLMSDGTTFYSKIIDFPTTPRDRIKTKRKLDSQKRKKIQVEDARVSKEQMKLQQMKIAEAHAPLVKLIGAEETSKILNNKGVYDIVRYMDGNVMPEDSLLLKNLSERYEQEVISKLQPNNTWTSLPNVYKQKPFKKYNDGDVLRNADGETKKIELTSFLPVKDKKLYKNPSVVNVHKEYYVEPTYIFTDGSYARLTDLEANGFKKIGKPNLSVVSDTKKMNKGGDMKRQMDLFEEGGLKDEGGTIDPVSGNDVPSGSTQEEVRDDIPAQLSEGEFVFPADVVRYIGLEKLMMMRQEAKAGLKRMEEMGQMGNSDEATIPDDVPFTVDDLDMEDDDTVEMAQGGVIQAANGTFVNTAPNVMYNPSQFATGQNLPSQQNNPNTQPISYNVPVYNPVPAGSYTPTYYNQLNQGNENIATFENLVGNNYGQYDELRKYISESGLVLNIPFKGGQPIYPIPEGYTYVDPEATKTEEVKTVTPTPQTTQVTQQDDGGDDPDGGGGAVDLVGDNFSYKSMFNMDTLDKAMKDIAGNQVSLFNIKDATTQGFKGSLDINNTTLSIQKDVLESFKLGRLNEKNQRVGGKNLVYGDNFNLADMNQTDRDFLGNRLNDISDRVKNLMTDSEGKAIDINGLVELVKSRGIATRVTKEAFYAKGTNIISKAKVKDVISRIIASDMRVKKDIQNRIKKGEYISDQTEVDKGYDFGAGISGAQIEDTSDRKGSQQSYEQESGYDDSSYSDYGDGSVADAYDDPLMNKGGLLKKKKPKVKKMKRGGLASRK